MTRNIHAPNYDYPEDTFVYGIESGGTGGRTTRAAATALGVISMDDIGMPGGPVPLVGQYIAPGVLPAEVPGFPAVSGPALVYDYIANTYQITNYDSNLTYAVSATVGTVSISGDTITYTTNLGIAPYIPPTQGGFTLNGKQFDVLVSGAYVETPSITSPVDAAIDRPTTLTLTSSPYQPMGVPSGHGSSTWQIATDSTFTTIVVSSVNDTVNLTSYTTSELVENTTYYARVSYKSISGVASLASATVMFSTKKNVASVETALLTKNTANLRIGESGVAISDAGDIVATVSVYNEKAYIYRRTGSTWSEATVLTDPAGRTGIYFGSSVALSGDGARLFIGAISGPSTSQPIGIVYVYLWSGTAWVLEATIMPATNNYARAGTSIAVSQTGDILVIGAPGHSSLYGKVFVYQRTGTTWASIKEIIDTTSSNYFGSRVACNSDATVIAITSVEFDNTSNTKVLPKIWTRAGTTFTLLQTVDYPTGYGSSSQFGYCVQIAGDGNTLLIGAYGVRRVFVYKKSGSTYTQVQYLDTLAAPAGSDGFGGSFCLTGDGKYVLVANRTRGYVGTFEWSLGSYKQIRTFGDGSALWLGFNMAITSNGLYAALSDLGYGTYTAFAGAGAIHIYS